MLDQNSMIQAEYLKRLYANRFNINERKSKGRPTSLSLLKIYLKLPFLWNIFGGQFFLKASKPARIF
jgi:hypothetical protein